MALKNRQKMILAALRELGGEAFIGEIAKKVNLSVIEVAQSLDAMHKLAGMICDGGITKWRLKE